VFTANDADEANEVVSKLTTKGDLLVTTGSALNRLAVGTNAHVLTADSAATNGVKWALSPETDLVTTKGDLLVATAADTLARQGVGSNGQVLVADSGVTNGVAWVDPQTNRNVVINGAMQVAQRGTSTTGITSGGLYTADRFYHQISASGTHTDTIENDAPTGSGFRNSLKVLCTTAAASPAAGSYHLIEHRFEGQNLQQFLKGTASAKQFALSFWVKSNVTGTYVVELLDADNSRQVAASYTVSASATWEKKTLIFPADTTGAFTNDNNLSLSMGFWLGAGTDFTSGTLQTTWASTTANKRAVGQTNLAAATNNYWQVTGVQLEVGSVATPFEFEDIGTTLAKCQRYYYRNSAVNASGAYAIFGLGQADNTTNVEGYIALPVAMRTAPSSIDVTATASNYAFYGGAVVSPLTSVPVFASANSGVLAQGVSFRSTSNATLGRAYQLLANNNNTAYIGFSAEL
jgi:hypothetical protein